MLALEGRACQVVKGPGSLVISAYCDMPDITKKVTPDLKLAAAGTGRLVHVDLGNGLRRTGGSALAQAYGQVRASAARSPLAPPKRRPRPAPRVAAVVRLLPPRGVERNVFGYNMIASTFL